VCSERCSPCWISSLFRDGGLACTGTLGLGGFKSIKALNALVILGLQNELARMSEELALMRLSQAQNVVSSPTMPSFMGQFRSGRQIREFVFLKARDKRLLRLVRITSVEPPESWGSICADIVRKTQIVAEEGLTSCPPPPFNASPVEFWVSEMSNWVAGFWRSPKRTWVRAYALPTPRDDNALRSLPNPTRHDHSRHAASEDSMVSNCSLFHSK
jgi:hypothetical protein